MVVKDYDNLDENQYVVTTQYTFWAGSAERRPDLVLFVKDFPLVLVEAKTPVRQSVSWFDGAKQVHDDYERFSPELFTPNVFSAATEGKDLRMGPSMPRSTNGDPGVPQTPFSLWGRSLP